MKKLFTTLLGIALLSSVSAQSPSGLIISEILAKPSGTESPYEYVELLATQTINFATTPYTVVVCTNGTATSNGWKQGSDLTYAFQISTGTVTAGQIIYIGGSSMLPISNGGTAMRIINTSSTNGDSFGNSNNAGVFGDGGSNADGVAVFKGTASSLSGTTVPIDALFFGNDYGTAYKSSGSGYQLPVNDRYNGGKLVKTSFLGPDPGAGDLIKATGGIYNPSTNTWTTARSWSTNSTPTYNATSITLAGTTNNSAPSVTLTSPASGSSYTAPATITIAATAADSDGTISKVEFYNGSTLLSSDVSSPYNYTWSSVAAGTYSITAKAYDNLNAAVTSTIVSVIVNNSAGNQLPTVTLTSPAAGSGYTAPATIAIAATAADSDGSISKVEFYNGSVLLSSDVSSPYSYTWSSVATGTYIITAKAYDNMSAATTSTASTVNVSATNQKPTIAFLPAASKLINETSGYISCVKGDVTDPVSVSGLDIIVADESLSTLTFTMTSSSSSVVGATAFTVTGAGANRKFIITPSGIGYTTITLNVKDNSGLTATTKISFTLAVSAKFTTNTVSNSYHTGFADASAAVVIDNDYMFVADDETSVIALYNRTVSGLPIYKFDPTPYLGLIDGLEGDIEAAFISPTNPNRIYWFSSQGNSKSGNIKPDRDRVFATDIVGSGANATLHFVGYYKGLRAKIISWGDANGLDLSAAAAVGEIPKQITGYNIEGVVMGPDNTTAYFGFRAPYVPAGTLNKALICPLLNFESWFNAGAPSSNPSFAAPIQISLGTRGIRDIEKNSLNQYIIVAGSYDATANFALYSWNGLASSAPVLLSTDLSGLNPEAISIVPESLTGIVQLHLISDNGSTILYNDAIEAKDLNQSNYKKFISSYVSVNFGGSARFSLMDATGNTTVALAYPNPTASTITIEIPDGVIVPYTYCILNAEGATVKEVKTIVSGQSILIDMSDLQPSLYVIRAEGLETIKVIKK